MVADGWSAKWRWAASDVPREEAFVTTKLANSEQGYDKPMAAFDAGMTTRSGHLLTRLHALRGFRQ